MNWTSDAVQGRAGCLDIPRDPLAGPYLIHRHHDDGWALYRSNGEEITPGTEMYRTTSAVAHGLSITDLCAMLNGMEVR